MNTLEMKKQPEKPLTIILIQLAVRKNGNEGSFNSNKITLNTLKEPPKSPLETILRPQIPVARHLVCVKNGCI